MEAESRSGRDLPSLRSALRHHITSIIVCTALALGFAALYVVNLPYTYTSSAVVLLAPAPGNPLTAEAASGSGTQTTVAMSTEAELVRTSAVRDIVADTLGRLAPDGRERLEVTIPTNTQMLEISFTSRTAKQAQEAAQAFAEGYLAFREERATSTQNSQLEALQTQIDAAEANLRRATSEAASAGTGSFAAQEVQLYTDRLAQLSTSRSAAEALNTAPGSIIAPAVEPAGANELPEWVYFVAAAAIGMLAGIAFALLREWRRDLVRDTNAAAEMDVAVFSTVPSPGSTLVKDTADDGTEHEAYRRLRAAVVANGPAPHILAVAGVEDESSWGIASNLAVVLAEAEFSVALIAADMSSAPSQDPLGIGRHRGLADSAGEVAAAREFLVETRGVNVLTAGLDTAGARDLTASPAFRAIVNSLHEDFDFVVIAAASAGSAEGDAALLASDSVLLILTSDRTKRARLNAALERFDRLGIDVLGAVKVTTAKAPETHSERSQRPTRTSRNEEMNPKYARARR